MLFIVHVCMYIHTFPTLLKRGFNTPYLLRFPWPAFPKDDFKHKLFNKQSVFRRSKTRKPRSQRPHIPSQAFRHVL